jgi:hypothetical protein
VAAIGSVVLARPVGAGSGRKGRPHRLETSENAPPRRARTGWQAISVNRWSVLIFFLSQIRLNYRIHANFASPRRRDLAGARVAQGFCVLPNYRLDWIESLGRGVDTLYL